MIEPIDTAPKDGTRILCLCADGRTQYCWWVGCNEAEGFWMTERETTPRAWYSNKRLPPGDPAVTPAGDTLFELPEAVCIDGIELPKGARVLYKEPGSVAPDASPVATDKHIADVFERIAGWRYNYPHTLDALRAIYNLGREHGATSAQRLAPPTSPVPVTQLTPGDRLVIDDEGKPVAILRSPATVPAPDRPLWELMYAATLEASGRGPCFYAATMRVVADWLVQKHNSDVLVHTAWEAAQWLRAEVERAESAQ